MKKTMFVLAAMVAAVSTAPAMADPAGMLGISYRFGEGKKAGSGWGITAKVISDDRDNKFVAAAGVSWYPGSSQQWGFDLGLGHTFENGVFTTGYDFVANDAVMGIGWADIKKAAAEPGAEGTGNGTPPGGGNN